VSKQAGAAPRSELASHRWLAGTSGPGDLLAVDRAALPLCSATRVICLLHLLDA